MGEVFFIAKYYEWRGESPPPYRGEVNYQFHIPSEITPPIKDLDGKTVLHLGGGTAGIWFYESNLWNKKLLKAKLRELIKEIDKVTNND